MQTLNRLGILDEMISESNVGTHFTFFNTDFTPLIEFRIPPTESLPQSNMCIARSKLREILIKNVSLSIPIHWNCAVESAHKLENGEILVDLSDGTQEQCNLLIVADGSNSVIRKALRPDHVLNFSGAISIMARTHALEKLPAPIDKTWGGVLGGNEHFLFVAPSDRTSALWSVSYLSSTPRQPKSTGTMTDDDIDEILAEA
jgi:2-polyprenyl-6-methoxyphenol hydroxylase-like FAD-dependent oxidoreductase